MNLARPERPSHDAQASATDVQAEIRGIVRREIAPIRRQPEPSSEAAPTDARSLVDRVSADSTSELDKLIGQLQTLREFFHNEGQRIQRELAEYAQLGDAVLKSTKTMAENMAQLKQTAEVAQNDAE